MAKTATVNRKRRRKTPRRRRRNPKTYGAATNRRRRYKRRSTRRRRNPSRYSSTTTGYYQRPNPDGVLDFQGAMEILPPATLGIGASRWAVNMAGPFELSREGIQEPGIKHAIAIWLAAGIGGDLIGGLLGDGRKSDIARIAALGWGGDLFLRKRFLRDNKWINENLYMGDGSSGNMGQDSFIDAAGNKFIRGPSGWRLAGFQDQSATGGGTDGVGQIQVPADAKAGDTVQTGDGRRYRLIATAHPDVFDLQSLGAFEDRTPIGSDDEAAMAATQQPERSAGLSSFGY